MDFSILHAVNGFFARHDGVEDPLTFYVGASQVLFAGLIVAAALLGGAGQQARRSAAVLAAGGLVIGLVLAQVLSRLVDRPRPFVSHPDSVHLFAKHAADAGFPSDHATAGFAVATALVLYDRRWGIPALVLAALLAFGRVAIGVHYPTDVLAGAALGAASTLALWRLGRPLVERVAEWLGAVRASVLGSVRAAA